MPTALYRRYRPESFSEVIGQEHVTDPLRSALRDGRVGHAYLFSGPRGCGKTTSARILARCLNCAQGPTDTPCGVCDSCVELARGGSGSLDVVEIDAASHGGVEDARELRDRATFATARDRFKVFIIDEAHMVSPQGFNALLKIVEEPPPHVKFVFATTEPDKVLATIRSRTHHYPFRLVPPEVLQRYLGEVCATEGVEAGTGVLPLVVRAGAGSVRDSLSVLDQLAAGAGDGGIDYERAIDLLGYTPQSLLDDVVSALAVGDGGAVFRIVDRVVQSGQDPRRFVDDLLQRLRDLIIVEAVGEAAASVFPGCPADQLDRMTQQAGVYGAAPLSRAADLANAASSEMTGATSPRLHLELLAARMLLPAADDAERGLAARLDRMERRLSVPGGGPVGPPAAGAGARSEQHGRAEVSAPAPAHEAPSPGTASASDAAPTSDDAASTSGAASTPDAPEQAPPSGTDDGPAEEEAASSTPAAEDVPAVDGACQAAAASGGSDAIGPGDPGSGSTAESTEAVRRMWPDVLEELARTSRRTWTRVSHDAAVLRVDETSVVLQLRQPGLLVAFSQGAHADNVRAALMTVLGLDRRVVAVGEGGEPSGAGNGSGQGGVTGSSPAAPVPAPGSSAAGGSATGAAGGGPSSTGPAGAVAWGAGSAGSAGDRPASESSSEASRSPSGNGAPTTSPPQPAAEPVPAGFVAGWDGPAPSDDDVPPDEDSIPPEGTVLAGGGTVRRSQMLREQLASGGPPGASGPSGSRAAGGEPGAGASTSDDEPSRDDVDAEDSGLVGAALVARRLGGRVIEDGGR